MDIKAIISDCTTAAIFASFYESSQLSQADSKSPEVPHTFRLTAFAWYLAIFAGTLIGCRSLVNLIPSARARTLTEGLFLGLMWCLMTARLFRRWRRKSIKS